MHSNDLCQRDARRAAARTVSLRRAVSRWSPATTMGLSLESRPTGKFERRSATTSVNTTWRVDRVSKAVSDASRRSMRRVTDDVATPRLRAALEKPAVSATSIKVFRASNLSIALRPAQRGVAYRHYSLSFAEGLQLCFSANHDHGMTMNPIEIRVISDFICPWCPKPRPTRPLQSVRVIRIVPPHRGYIPDTRARQITSVSTKTGRAAQ